MTRAVAGDLEPARGRFNVLRFMATVKAARDFGLDPGAANSIALEFDPQNGDLDKLVEALANALIERGALSLPEAV